MVKQNVKCKYKSQGKENSPEKFNNSFSKKKILQEIIFFPLKHRKKKKSPGIISHSVS